MHGFGSKSRFLAYEKIKKSFILVLVKIRDVGLWHNEIHICILEPCTLDHEGFIFISNLHENKAEPRFGHRRGAKDAHEDRCCYIM